MQRKARLRSKKGTTASEGGENRITNVLPEGVNQINFSLDSLRSSGLFIYHQPQTSFGLPKNKNPLAKPREKFICGENGIRTHEALLELTHFPGVRLRPLGHLSREGVL